MVEHTKNSPHTSSNTTQWDIPSFYHKSWQVVKAQPVLWLLGLATVIFTGSSFNFNSGSNWGSSDEQESVVPDQKRAPSEDELAVDPNYTDEIIGIENADVAFPTQIDKTLESKERKDKFEALFDLLSPQLSQVPFPIYALLALEIIFLILLSIATAVIGMNWSEAALLKAFEYFAKGEKPTTSQISNTAFPYIIPLFKYNMLSVLIGVGFIAAFSMSLILSGVIAALTGIKALVGLFVMLVVAITLYYFVKITTTLRWGRLYLLFENTGAKGAIRSGWELSHAKGVWFKTLRLSAVNFFASIIVGIMAVLVFGSMIGLPAAGLYFASQFAVIFVPLLILAFLIGFPLMMFINALMKSITGGTWYFAFQVIKHYRKQST